jgi:hypothetical protein
LSAAGLAAGAMLTASAPVYGATYDEAAGAAGFDFDWNGDYIGVLPIGVHIIRGVTSGVFDVDDASFGIAVGATLSLVEQRVDSYTGLFASGLLRGPSGGSIYNVSFLPGAYLVVAASGAAIAPFNSFLVVEGGGGGTTDWRLRLTITAAPTAVPEPSTYALMGSMLLATGALRHRKRARSRSPSLE